MLLGGDELGVSRRRVDLLDARARFGASARDGLDRLLGDRLDARPVGRAHEGDARGLARRVGRRRARWILGRCEGGISGGKYAHGEPEVGHAAGEEPDRVERRGEELDSVAGKHAERRLEADHAAVGPGAVDRARRLRTGGDGDGAGGDGGGRSARGPSGGPRVVEGVDGVGGEHPRELRQLRLTGDHRSRRAQEAHGARVAGGLVPRVDRRAVGGRVVDGVEVVLDADQEAEHGELRSLARAEPVEGGGALEEHGFVDRRPRAELILADRGEDRLGDRHTSELARSHAVTQRDGAVTE